MRPAAGNFLRAHTAAVPPKIHTMLTDKGCNFTGQSASIWPPGEITVMRTDKVFLRCHSFGGAAPISTPSTA
ncbi:hypothetical protein GPNCGGLF_LOCUS4041 [Methylorubrum aminovorans]